MTLRFLRPPLVVLGPLVLGLLVWVAPVRAQTVVDYYNAVRDADGDLALDYRFQQIGGQWRVAPAEYQTIVETVVDIPNGYMRVVDEGTGGGNFRLEVALFRTANGAPLLAVAGTGYSGSSAVDGWVEVFAPLGTHQWQRVTDQVWPATDVAVLVPPGGARDDGDLLRAVRVSLVPELPRHGTVAWVRPGYDSQIVDAVCRGEDWISVGEAEADFLRFCADLRHRLYRRVDVPFSKSQGRFFMGEGQR